MLLYQILGFTTHGKIKKVKICGSTGKKNFIFKSKNFIFKNL